MFDFGLFICMFISNEVLLFIIHTTSILLAVLHVRNRLPIDAAAPILNIIIFIIHASFSSPKRPDRL